MLDRIHQINEKKNNLNYRFPFRKSHFRVQNRQIFRLRPPMTPHQSPQNFAYSAGENIILFVMYCDRVLKSELFLSTLFCRKKVSILNLEIDTFLSILKSPKKGLHHARAAIGNFGTGCLAECLQAKNHRLG